VEEDLKTGDVPRGAHDTKTMPRNNRKRDPIPDEFASIEEAAEFWDTHDLTDYEDIWHEVDFRVDLKRQRHPRVELDPRIANEFAKRARAKRMTLAALVNRVLKDYLKTRAA
jgi:hypothetical protein